MILKRKIADNWDFIDNITHLQVGKTEEFQTQIFYYIGKEELNSSIVLCENDYAYLLNDTGKIIQYILGKKIREDQNKENKIYVHSEIGNI